jgi:hypothetical protein
MGSDCAPKKEGDSNEALKKMLSDLKCSKNFICCTSGFKTLCKAQYIGNESFLGCLVECLEDDPQKCRFSHQFKTRFLCNCPLRTYIAMKNKKEVHPDHLTTQKQ